MRIFSFLIIITMMALVSTPTHAAINPDLVICERYDMTLQEEISAGGDEYLFCAKDDGTVCSIEDVYGGFCGEEYLPHLACVTEGNHVFDQFEVCCEGLVPYLPDGFSGQPSCKKINKTQEFFGQLVDLPIFWIIVVAVLTGAIPAAINWKKYKKQNEK